ncbi:unnamed protein product [Urochloa humidicola]
MTSKRTVPWHRLSEAEVAVNRAVAASCVGRYFKLDSRKSSFTKELRAGAATFLTMAYIISVNAAVLSDSGGPCTVRDCTPVANLTAVPGPECTVGPNPGYEQCLARTKSDLVVATAVAAMAGSFSYFKKVVDFHMIRSTAGQLSFGGFRHGGVWLAFLTLLYVDVLDTTGTMYSMAEYGGFVTDEAGGGFEGEYRAFLVDAGSTVLSAGLGSSTVTTYIESTAGIREGGRTGLTAITVAACFLGSLFFGPLLMSVPPWAVGPSLVLVGTMMMRAAKEIEWGDMKEGVPAFVTMALMPLSFSIANGIIAGLGVYVALHWYDWARHGYSRVRGVLDERRNQVAAAAGEVGVGPAAAQDVV